MNLNKAALVSVGCKVSQYDAQTVSQSLIDSGYEIVDFSQKADVYIISTCSVTNVGDKKSRKLINRARNQSHEAIVIVMGCYSQTNPNEVINIPGVDIVVGTKGLNQIVTLIESYRNNKHERKPLLKVDDISENVLFEENGLKQAFKDRTRAYVKIQDGCEQFCSYCIVPYARGAVKSRAADNIKTELLNLANSDVKEIVLTGIHLASYGNDFNNKISLIDVIKMTNEIEGIKRIRLGSLEPGIVDEKFLESLSGTSKFCPYFHLSLQSGCNKTLKEMNRKYTVEKYKKSVDLIYNYFPHSAVWTDVITGFPGENQADFNESKSFIKESGIRKIHVFPYSPKKGTPAASYPNQIETFTKNERARELRELSSELYQNFLEMNLGRNAPVLFERANEDGFLGYTDNYIEVAVTSDDKSLINSIKDIKLDCLLNNETVKGII